MKFSKVLLLIVVLAMAFAVVGCGADTTALEAQVADVSAKADAAQAAADDAAAAAAEAQAKAAEAVAKAAEVEAMAAEAGVASAEEIATIKAEAEAAKAEAEVARAEAEAAKEAAAAQPAPAASAAGEKSYGDLVVGFAQIGAESEWRTAETQSIKDTAEELGVELKFSDAQQKQENQIKAVRSFIAQGVDVIGIAPVVASGWETVFQEAKDAGIPVVLVDRKADVPEDLYATFIGSDFVWEGERACKLMAEFMGEEGNIVELQGTVGADPATDRQTGFMQCLEENYPNMKVIATQSGDFTRAKGKEVMEAFLKTHGEDIQGVYAHNDDMAIGAIQAIEEYGLKPGEDIKIVSIDGVRGAFEAMVEGKLNATCECNPLLGPQFYEAALTLANGGTVDKWIVSNETDYTMDQAADVIDSRLY